MQDDDRQLAELHEQERWNLDHWMDRKLERMERSVNEMKRRLKNEQEMKSEDAEHCGRR